VGVAFEPPSLRNPSPDPSLEPVSITTPKDVTNGKTSYGSIWA